MKEFRYKLGHKAGQTMTVSELIEKLREYPLDMPVMAEWEGVHAYIEQENFSIEKVGKGHPDDECEGLVICVDCY